METFGYFYMWCVIWLSTAKWYFHWKWINYRHIFVHCKHYVKYKWRVKTRNEWQFFVFISLCTRYIIFPQLINNYQCTHTSNCIDWNGIVRLRWKAYHWVFIVADSYFDVVKLWHQLLNMTLSLSLMCACNDIF